ncbi:MAG: hypothetical protein AAF628_34935 [Planctomycetota bacterium]
MRRALLSVALAAAAVAAQEPAPADAWTEAVTKACAHRRFAVRRAAANKVGRAGDAAVPAIRAYIVAQGAARVSQLLVEAVAATPNDGDAGDPATTALLEEWARERTFYWRAQALRGLAARRLPEHRALFWAALDDASYLFRIAGARGAFGVDAEAARPRLHALVDADPDPRVRVQVAAFLLEQDDDHGVPVLLAALALQAQCLGDPWGRREAERAFRALRAAADGKDFGYRPGGSADDNRAGIAAFTAALAPARAAADATPIVLAREAPAFAGGVVIRSCRNGDLVVRWTAAGAVYEGLDPRPTATVPPAAWAAIAARAGDLEGDGRVHGRVICDSIDVVSAADADRPRRWKCAPGAVPAPLWQWLGDLTQGLRQISPPHLAEELEGRLPQFSESGG